MKQNRDRMLYDLKACEKDADLLPLKMKYQDGLWSAFEHNLSFCNEEVATAHANEVQTSVSDIIPSYEKDLFNQESHVCRDKLVTDDELPELIVCYKESADNVVKDICVDEGVPSQDKLIIENSKGNGFHFQGPDSDENIEDKEKVGIVLKFSDNVNFFEEKDYSEDGSVKESIREASINEKQKRVHNKLAVGESGTESSITELSSSLGNKMDDRSVECSQEVLISHISASKELKGCCAVGELSSDKRTESGSMTFRCDASTPEASGSEKSHDVGDNEWAHEAESVSRPESRKSVDIAPTVPSQLNHGTGDTSFSAAGPVSGVITYSGPIAYSGSLSLRSDSSTTSTRSFAFPILQSEWNSSPVRMAKAERRHLRKHKSWRQGILCCRF